MFEGLLGSPTEDKITATLNTLNAADFFLLGISRPIRAGNDSWSAPESVRWLHTLLPGLPASRNSCDWLYWCSLLFA